MKEKKQKYNVAYYKSVTNASMCNLGDFLKINFTF